MNKFTKILSEATANIEDIYFKLIQYDADDVYRERVYCYELYHQMRKLWVIDDAVLNGEVDKAGHPALKNTSVARAKPDFLVHFPGDMRKNHIVIEVKSTTVKNNALKVDLKNLAEFKTQVGYKRAIFLIYGTEYSDGEWLSRVQFVASKVSINATIELWRHHNSLHKAKLIGEICTGIKP